MKSFNLSKILRSKATAFTFKELLIASGEQKPDLLKRRLNYYVRMGQLYAIRRGLYAKDKNYNKFELATKIYIPSYISFETVLRAAGIIYQHYSAIFVATYQTKEIECDNQIYVFRKIKDVILTNNAGIKDKDTYSIATAERAFLDMLYLHKDYYFDNLSPLNFDKIYDLLSIYNNKRMVRAVDSYFKKLKKGGL
jgi:predicted transcriptional regulator of viral defense system